MSASPRDPALLSRRHSLLSRRHSLLSRRHLGFAGVTLALAAVGAASISILSEDAPSGGSAPPQSLASLASLGDPAPRVESHDPRVSLPAVDAAEPRGRAPLGPADLPPLARTWRAAVVSSQREQVLAGARALRSAPDAREQLLLLARDADPRVRAYALRELGRRKDPTVADAFRAALRDESPHVVENARWGLGELRGLDAPRDLERAGLSPAPAPQAPGRTR